MVFIGDVWYYWKLVAVDDIGGRGGGSGGGGGVGTGTGHIGVYLDSGDGDKTVMEKLLTSYMGEWCRCWWRCCWWQWLWCPRCIDGALRQSFYILVLVEKMIMVSCCSWKTKTCGLGSCEVELWTSPTATHVDNERELASSLPRRRRMVKEFMKKTIIMKWGGSYQRTF